jgi:AcrR family transcriptional regulator
MGRRQSRERLIAAAFALFEERGYEQTTVDDIAERAGVGRTTFFRVFGSKEEVIFPDHDSILRAIDDRLAGSSQQTALVAVTEAVRLVLRHYLAEGELALSRYRLTRTVPALRDREMTSTRQYQRVFYRFILDWLGGGPDTALRAELMAAAVVTTHNHVLRRWLRGQTEQPEVEFDAAMSWTVGLFAERPELLDPPGVDTAVVVFRTAKGIDDVLPALRSLLDES